MHFVINYIKHTLLFNGSNWLFSLFVKGLNLISIMLILTYLTSEDQSLTISLLIQYSIIIISVFLSTIILMFNNNAVDRDFAFFIFLFIVLFFCYLSVINKIDALRFLLLFLIIINSIISLKRFSENYIIYFLSKLKNEKVELFFSLHYILKKEKTENNYFFHIKDFDELGQEIKQYLSILFNKNNVPIITINFGNDFNFKTQSPQKLFEYFVSDIVKQEITDEDKFKFDYALELKVTDLFQVPLLLIFLIVFLKISNQIFLGDYLASLYTLLTISIVSIFISLVLYFVYESLRSLTHSTLKYISFGILSLSLVTIFEVAKSDLILINFNTIRWVAFVSLLLCFFISFIPLYNSLQEVLNNWILLRLEIIKAILTLILGLLVILFNPLFPIYLNNKELWILLDWIAQGVILSTIAIIIAELLINRKSVHR